MMANNAHKFKSSDPGIMAPNKKRKRNSSRDTSCAKKTRICEHCSKTITNFATHLDKSKDCREYYYSNNQISVANNMMKQQLNSKSSSENESNQQHQSKSKYSKLKDRHPTYFNQDKSFIQPAASEIIMGHYTPINEMSFQPNDGGQNEEENTILNDDMSVNIPNHNLGTSLSTTNDYSSLSYRMHSLLNETTIDIPTLLSIKLFKIMNQPNVPLNMYDKVNQFMKHSLPILMTSNKKSLWNRSRLLTNMYDIILQGSKLSKLEMNDNNSKHKFDLFPKNIETKLSQCMVPVQVPTFDLKSMIVSLLLDPLTMQKQNLLMHDKDYQYPQQANHNSFGEIHTGYWFKNAHKNLCKHKDDLLCPLIMFVDGVGLDVMQRQSLEPVTFTLGIFNRNARNSELFWRVLGYIPNPEKHCNVKYESYSNSATLKKEHYHQLLNVILSDLKSLQDDGGFRWTFQCGKTFNLKFPIMYVIGDALGLDKLCNRKETYTPTKTFMTGCCRDCNSVYKHCHDPQFICKQLKPSYFNRLKDKVIRAMTFEPIKNNAFTKLCFGYNDRNILNSSPPEPLHQWYLGIVKLTIEYFWSRISNPVCNYIDNIVRGIATECHRQSDRSIPTIANFQKGLMKDKTTGMEKGNQLFVLYLALLPTMVRDKVVEIDSESRQRFTMKDNDKLYFDKIVDTKPKFDKWFCLFEKMLSISEYYKLTEVPKSDVIPSIDVTLKKDTSIFDPDILSKFDTNHILDEDDIQSNEQGIIDVNIRISKLNNSMRQFMQDLSNVFDDDDQIKLMTLKNHHNLHYSATIQSIGAVPNFDGGCNEQNMKSQVTQPSQKTQGRTKSLAIQTATRYAENMIIDIGHNIAIHKGEYESTQFKTKSNYFQKVGSHNFHVKMNNIDADEQSATPVCFYTTGYQTFTYYDDYESDENADRQLQQYITREIIKKKTVVTESLTNNSIYSKTFIGDVFQLLNGIGVFPDNNEIKKISSFETLKIKGDIYRSSMSFYGDEWLDWVHVKWSIGDDLQSIIPCKLLLFIDIDKTQQLNHHDINTTKRDTCPDGKYWAVVKSAKCKCAKTRSKSNIATYYEMENDLHLISCDNIESPAYVIYDRDYHMTSDPLQVTGELKRVISISHGTTWSNIFLIDDAFNKDKIEKEQQKQKQTRSSRHRISQTNQQRSKQSRTKK